MNIEHLQSFLAISKYKSLSKAAQSLYITQPTLSSRMTTLENYLQLKLFKRSWKGIKLTEHGILFLPIALMMLNRLEDFTSLSKNFVDNNNEPYFDSVEKIHHTFQIGINNYLVDTYADPIIEALSSNFPKLAFNITTASTKELTKEVYYGSLDYILYYDFHPTLPNTEMIKHEEMVVILTEEDYLKIGKDVKGLEKLQKPLLLNSNPVFNRYQSYFQRFQDYLKVDEILMISNVSLINILIKRNQGYSILPETVYEAQFKKDGLYKLPIPNSLTKLPIYGTHREDNDKFLSYSLFLNECLHKVNNESATI